MLADRRDPIFDHGTPGPSASSAAGHTAGHAAVHVAPRPAGFTRFIAGVQILGTVLGIPLGLASGYSIYRANFSPEAKCGALRANIISMLDKNADASTLRLLVRRDVDTFEHSCGSVDPDAVAAFKTLLAKPAAVAAAPKEVKTVKTVKAAEVVKPIKVEKTTEKKVVHAVPAAHVAHARQEAAKREATRVAHVDEKAARAKADANWLAAVRRALVDHGPVARAQAAEVPVQPAPAPVAPPVVQPMAVPAPAQAQAAPPLPAATVVVDAAKNGESHPVPPAMIPDVGPQPAQ